MFKLTGSSGSRKSGGAASSGRVNSTQMGHMTPLETQVLRQPAFQPRTPMEHGFDANSPRLGGLEK